MHADKNTNSSTLHCCSIWVGFIFKNQGLINVSNRNLAGRPKNSESSPHYVNCANIQCCKCPGLRTNVLQIGNWQTLMYKHQVFTHPVAALFCMKWRDGRHLEIVTSNQKSVSDSMCIYFMNKQSCQISSQSHLKWWSLGLVLKMKDNNKDQ